MASVVMKLMELARKKRGWALLVVSVISALVAAKAGGNGGGSGGIQYFGYWDGPS